MTKSRVYTAFNNKLCHMWAYDKRSYKTKRVHNVCKSNLAVSLAKQNVYKVQARTNERRENLKFSTSSWVG